LSKTTTEESKEKEIIIKGGVIGEPLHTRYGSTFSDFSVYYELKFLVKSSTDIVANFKRSESLMLPAGTSSVVVCSEPCYLRMGDQIEFLARIAKVTLKNGKQCHFISTSHLYNETLQFSFNY